MTDQALDILKLALLALLYLFFARVLWTVWSEVRQSVDARSVAEVTPGRAPATRAPEPRRSRSPKGRRSTPTELVVLEPKERRGTTFAISDGLGIGREGDNTVVITGDAYVSGHHAKIAFESDRITIVDLASRNGTMHNGRGLTEPASIRVGDRIQIGMTVLEAR